MVYEDETVVAFTDLYPVTPGHLLVVPREHAVGLEDLDAATGAHVWSVGRDMARDGWTLKAASPPERERSLLDNEAQAIKDAIVLTD